MEWGPGWAEERREDESAAVTGIICLLLHMRFALISATHANLRLDRCEADLLRLSEDTLEGRGARQARPSVDIESVREAEERGVLGVLLCERFMKEVFRDMLDGKLLIGAELRLCSDGRLERAWEWRSWDCCEGGEYIESTEVTVELLGFLLMLPIRVAAKSGVTGELDAPLLLEDSEDDVRLGYVPMAAAEGEKKGTPSSLSWV